MHKLVFFSSCIFTLKYSFRVRASQTVYGDLSSIYWTQLVQQVVNICYSFGDVVSQLTKGTSCRFKNSPPSSILMDVGCSGQHKRWAYWRWQHRVCFINQKCLLCSKGSPLTHALKLLLAVMECRGDSENAERALYNMNPRQLVDLLACLPLEGSPTRGRDEADRGDGSSLPGQGIHILSFVCAVMPMSAAVAIT